MATILKLIICIPMMVRPKNMKEALPIFYLKKKKTEMKFLTDPDPLNIKTQAYFMHDLVFK